MWILNQTKTKIVNSDNIAGVYIDNSGRQIKANIVGLDDSCLLACYETAEDCKDALAAILLTVASGKVTYITLPKADGVESWKAELIKTLG